MRRNRTTLAAKNTPSGHTPPDATDAGRASEVESGRRRPRRPVTLAGRIMTWSGNLLATCVIVILGLTFGRQVLHWWHDDPPRATRVDEQTARLGTLADPSLPQLLAFGDLPFLFDRQAFEGDEAAALARLRTCCRAVAADNDPRRHAPLPVTESLLRRLASQEPVEQGPDWRIVQNSGPVITVVALRMARQPAGGEANVASQNVESVVSWGLGFRAPETATEEAASQQRWTLFTCSGTGHAVDSDLQLSLPIPPGCHRTLAVRVKSGGALLGFTGPGSAGSGKQFFDQAYVERGWRRETEWTQIGTSWHARFQEPASGICDVQIISNADGTISGILTVTAGQGSER